MKLWSLTAFPILLLSAFLLVVLASGQPPASQSWPQWGHDAQHDGFIAITGQSASHKLAEIQYDPFVGQEKLDSGGNELLAHYQVPLIEGNSVYMEFKTGKWIPCHPPTAWINGKACGPNTWDKEIWNEKRLDWQNGKLVERWNYETDWKPEPNAAATGLGGWEPVFHPVLTHNFVYVPGFGGTIWKVNKSDGKTISHINPFTSINKNTFVSGPLTADAQGNVYYNVLKLDATNPWENDVAGSWLVKVTPDDKASSVTFKEITKGAPKGTDMCPLYFYQENTLPWPPSKHAKPIKIPCGTQRPGVNIAPAVAPDGTIYTVSRAHIDLTIGYMIAVNPDLTPKWHTPLFRQMHDGCGVLVPIATRKKQPNACREGANRGVDPTTNDWGSGWILDEASATPTVLPDGSVLMGVITDYNGFRGHLMKYSDGGRFLGSYGFGWDSTPAVYPHDGTYSIVIKDNHYPGGLYCSFANNPICKPLPPGPYYVTQLSADLKVEWHFKNTTIDKNHPNGYEWCINAPAIDANGTVYVNSEDGHAYVLSKDGKLQSKLFLKLALGAAYTPLSLGPDGKIYTQNDGELFVVGQ